MGVLASTGEVFFKTAESSFSITIVVPLAGTYQVALKGRAGSTVFAEGHPLCTHEGITEIRQTRSFWVCASEPSNTGRWQTQAGCKTVDAKNGKRAGNFEMKLGENTLWLAPRNLCALASHLNITLPPPPPPPALPPPPPSPPPGISF